MLPHDGQNEQQAQAKGLFNSLTMLVIKGGVVNCSGHQRWCKAQWSPGGLTLSNGPNPLGLYKGGEQEVLVWYYYLLLYYYSAY